MLRKLPAIVSGTYTVGATGSHGGVRYQDITPVFSSSGLSNQIEFEFMWPLPATVGTLGGKSATRGWWSTDMPSNPGESGAPVFSDSTGKVVAIKAGGYDDAQKLNLVIPINLAGPLLTQVPDLSTIPSATAPTNFPVDTLISGNSTVYNGFRDPGESVFKFATQTRREWGWLDADLGVANPVSSFLPVNFVTTQEGHLMKVEVKP